MSMTPVGEEHIDLLKDLGLKEYQAKSLAYLLELGESKAPELSSVSGVPKARIYGVLEDLADRGLIEVKPGRPTRYLPKSPDEIVERMIHNRRREFEEEVERMKSKEGELKSKFQPLYESSAKEVRKPLLKTVSVGEPSERETELMYREAEEEIDIATKSMEWLPEVKGTLKGAIDRGVEVKVLFLSKRLLEDENLPVQRESIETLRKELPGIQIRFSEFLLPLRGSIVDPSYNYTSGRAIFLVEEKGVPLELRDAAITENPSLVAGMKRYFDLIWEHESNPVEGYSDGR